MAAFECNRCGKCCVSLGPSIIIERQLNDRDYYCRCSVDNAIFLARVDPAFQEEIADEFLMPVPAPPVTLQKSCPFLRKKPKDETMTCAIFATRPEICRTFRCYRMIIRDTEGKICGKVIGKNTLRTEDKVLEDIWNHQAAAVPYGDAAAWARTITGILAGHGYRAEIIE